MRAGSRIDEEYGNRDSALLKKMTEDFVQCFLDIVIEYCLAPSQGWLPTVMILPVSWSSTGRGTCYCF